MQIMMASTFTNWNAINNSGGTPCTNSRTFWFFTMFLAYQHAGSNAEAASRAINGSVGFDNETAICTNNEAFTDAINIADILTKPATCAAGNLYSVKGTLLENPRNGELGRINCMVCRKPMHGPLCNANWNERDSSLNLPDDLSPKTKKHANAVICAICIHNQQHD